MQVRFFVLGTYLKIALWRYKLFFSKKKIVTVNYQLIINTTNKILWIGLILKIINFNRLIIIISEMYKWS